MSIGLKYIFMLTMLNLTVANFAIVGTPSSSNFRPLAKHSFVIVSYDLSTIE